MAVGGYAARLAEGAYGQAVSHVALREPEPACAALGAYYAEEGLLGQ